MVKQAARQIDFSDTDQFDDRCRAFFRLVRRHGARAAAEIVRERVERAPGATAVSATIAREHRLLEYVCAPGKELFRRLPSSLKDFIPFNDIEVAADASGEIYRVRFRTLRSVRSPHGTIYYAPKGQQIEIDGTEKIVGFHRHAIERVCERLVANWRSYEGLGDAFAAFGHCKCSVGDLPNGEKAVSLWSRCGRPPFATSLYASYILGFDRPEGEYWFRVGYGPLHVYNEFAAAKTLLLPGFRGTPEHDFLRRNAPRNRKRELLKRSEGQGWECLVDSTNGQRSRIVDFPLLKMFHDFGIEQVRNARDL